MSYLFFIMVTYVTISYKPLPQDIINLYNHSLLQIYVELNVRKEWPICLNVKMSNEKSYKIISNIS